MELIQVLVLFSAWLGLIHYVTKKKKGTRFFPRARLVVSPTPRPPVQIGRPMREPYPAELIAAIGVLSANGRRPQALH